MKKITFLRTVVQLLFFFLIIYSGFLLGLKKIDLSFLPFIEPPPSYRPEERIKTLKPAAGYTQIFDTYLPPKTCRFIALEPRLFRACALHFFSESLTWLTSLKYLLPHIFLFLILAFLFGRFWCGWLCPLGFISDLLAMVRKYLKLAYFNLPEIFQNFLTKFKYGFLLFIFFISLAIAFPVFSAYQKEFFIVGCQTCPGRILFPLLTGKIPQFYSFDSPILIFFSLVGILFLIIFIVSAFVKRFWCRICPSGALLSFFNLGGAMTKEKDVLKCTRCGTCARVCPVQNKKVYQEKKIEHILDKECIRCFKCIEKCPETDCLKVKIFGKTIFKSKFK